MKPEAKVGLMFIVAIGLVILFAFYLGALNPFSNADKLNVAFNYAGGIEVGSPVRVMGIKVGKVKEVRFEPELKMPSGEEVKLVLEITVNKRAWGTLRQDSQVFINLAGVIGEKFVEITPGSMERDPLEPGSLIRGEDPPRIDQLISQGYGLAGKIMEFVESNEGSVIDTINMMNKLVGNLNKLLKEVDSTSKNKEVATIMKNLTALTSDLAYFSSKVRTEDGQKTMLLIRNLIWRLEQLDGPAIKKFLQEEGIKARMF